LTGTPNTRNCGQSNAVFSDRIHAKRTLRFHKCRPRL
jgi:hypothetical protein